MKSKTQNSKSKSFLDFGFRISDLSPSRNGRRGLSLIEVVIGLALVGVLIITFAVSLSAAVAARRIKFRNIAAALADQQLAVLRTYDPSLVAEQTDGEMIGVLFTQGNWETAADATAPSGSNAFLAESATTSGVTAVMPLPKNAYADFTLTASFKTLSGAPTDWRTGFLFRSADLQNGYRVYLTSTSLVLEKIEDGVVTELYSDIRSVSTDSWQTLSVVTSGSSIEVLLNGISATTASDSTFAIGKAALAVWQGASAHFDDVSIGGTSWDFDTVTVGEIPDGWDRFGLSNLPNSSGSLTIETQFSDASFKKYTATINWTDGSHQRTLSQSTSKAN